MSPGGIVGRGAVARAVKIAMPLTQERIRKVIDAVMADAQESQRT